MAEDLAGAAAMRRKLEQLATETPKKAGRAIYRRALPIMRNSMRRTPVETGAARASHELSEPQYHGRDISVVISVGGPALDYVVPLHERLDVHHDVGEAKFLEKSIHEAAPTFLADVAEDLGLGE